MVATEEGNGIVGIPLVVGMTIVVVEPAVAVVRIHVEHVRVSIGVRPYVWSAFLNTTLRFFSGLNRIRHHNALAFHTKHLQFFERHVYHTILNRNREYSGHTDAGFGRGEP